MSIDDAIYHTVHGYPGGVVALAARMGMSANTLTHKADPNNNTHFMRPRELLAVQHLSGNKAILRAMERVLMPAGPDVDECDPVEAVMRLQCAVADFVRALADPLARYAAGGDGYVSGNEMRRAEYHASALQLEIARSLAAVRARMRPAPVAEG